MNANLKRPLKCPRCARRGVLTCLSAFYSWIRRCKFYRFVEPVPILWEEEAEA